MPNSVTSMHILMSILAEGFQGCMQKFCKGERSSKQCQGEHWKTMLKKISLVILRGGEIDTRRGECPPAP